MVGMECLQLRTINLQAFKRTKPCAEEPVGCWRRLRAFSPRGKELGAGRDRALHTAETASVERWSLRFYQILEFGFFPLLFKSNFSTCFLTDTAPTWVKVNVNSEEGGGIAVQSEGKIGQEARPLRDS